MGLTIWLIITVILIVVEIITLGLTSIWFAGGAFVAGLISLTGAHWLVQLLVFAVVSTLLFVFTRPICGEASDEECGEDECRQSDWKRRNRQAGDQQSGGTGCCEAFGHGMVCTFRR